MWTLKIRPTNKVCTFHKSSLTYHPVLCPITGPTTLYILTRHCFILPLTPTQPSCFYASAMPSYISILVLPIPPLSQEDSSKTRVTFLVTHSLT